MLTSHSQHLESPGGELFRFADIRANLWRRAALAELEHMIGQAVIEALTDVADEMTITSVQRGDHYAAVTVSGPADARAIQRLAAHLGGLLNAGARHLVVDLSRVTHIDDQLLDLMRKVEARAVALNGVFELMGLAPNVLYAMDDGPVAEVFALYRATLDVASSHAMSWAGLRCPEGLGEVPEPRTAGRHRSIIDVTVSS